MISRQEKLVTRERICSQAEGADHLRRVKATRTTVATLKLVGDHQGASLRTWIEDLPGTAVHPFVLMRSRRNSIASAKAIEIVEILAISIMPNLGRTRPEALGLLDTTGMAPREMQGMLSNGEAGSTHLCGGQVAVGNVGRRRPIMITTGTGMTVAMEALSGNEVVERKSLTVRWTVSGHGGTDFETCEKRRERCGRQGPVVDKCGA